jgi:hypothetical protein
VEVEAGEVSILKGGGQAKGEVSVEWAPWRLRADTLEWSQSGTFKAERVWITPCDCDSPPWALRARRVEGEVGERATLRGGALEVCGKALLPIPWLAVPLRERRTGLRFPRVGYGVDGWSVAQPVFLSLGKPAEITLAPEWRSEGALRLLGDGAVRTGMGPEGQLGGAIGMDTWGAVPRGMADVDLAMAKKRMRLGVDAAWLSDPRYLSDYESDFLGRSQLWTESLLVAGVGPMRLESDTFGPTGADVDGLAQRPVAGVLSLVGQPVGPLSATAIARVDMVDSGAGTPESRTESARVAVALHGGRRAGPVQLESRAEARTIQWIGQQPWNEGRVWGAARLDLWGDAGDLRHLADVGVAGSAARGLGVPSARLMEDLPAPAWSIGPSLRSRWLSAAGVPVSLEAELPWTEHGLLPTGTGRAQLGAWTSRISGNSLLQEARSWWDDGRLHLGVGAVRYDALLQAQGETAWTLPAPVNAWRPGWRGLQDLHSGRLLSHGPTLSFDSPCDCLRLEAGAAWSTDRDLPEFQVRVDLR